MLNIDYMVQKNRKYEEKKFQFNPQTFFLKLCFYHSLQIINIFKYRIPFLNGKTIILDGLGQGRRKFLNKYI